MHPQNTLNELSGEEWLYFTKSLWSTAYPSELGHVARKAHGANKPPRLMARLIEFFTRPDELVLDPFAGVGGTLLGAAICRRPRRALGFEIEPRWAAVYETVVRDAVGQRDGAGPLLADLGTSDPGGPRGFDPSGCRFLVGDALRLLPDLERGSVDFVATDPPYNPQLKLDHGRGPAGGDVRQPPHRLRDGHRRRRRPRQQRVIRRIPRPHGGGLGRARHACCAPGRYATIIVRDAYQEGHYRFTGRTSRAGPNGPASSPRVT